MFETYDACTATGFYLDNANHQMGFARKSGDVWKLNISFNNPLDTDPILPVSKVICIKLFKDDFMPAFSTPGAPVSHRPPTRAPEMNVQDFNDIKLALEYITILNEETRKSLANKSRSSRSHISVLNKSTSPLLGALLEAGVPEKLAKLPTSDTEWNKFWRDLNRMSDDVDNKVYGLATGTRKEGKTIGKNWAKLPEGITNLISESNWPGKAEFSGWVATTIRIFNL
ncbi:hypothetical protein RhiJN_07880 [Ceratobasidium sp. AG-Ba]|nr:hypothetical protein RhiJN_07880 [Ceratobasidium sp. AG-Ba]QRW08689.1 hypothetical protein RhiLY_07688 [Ceratobasidium sp. AG-Ba]